MVYGTCSLSCENIACLLYQSSLDGCKQSKDQNINSPKRLLYISCYNFLGAFIKTLLTTPHFRFSFISILRKEVRVFWRPDINDYLRLDTMVFILEKNISCTSTPGLKLHLKQHCTLRVCKSMMRS